MRALDRGKRTPLDVKEERDERERDECDQVPRADSRHHRHSRLGGAAGDQRNLEEGREEGSTGSPMRAPNAQGRLPLGPRPAISRSTPRSCMRPASRRGLTLPADSCCSCAPSRWLPLSLPQSRSATSTPQRRRSSAAQSDLRTNACRRPTPAGGWAAACDAEEGSRVLDKSGVRLQRGSRIRFKVELSSIDALGPPSFSCPHLPTSPPSPQPLVQHTHSKRVVL